MAYLSRVAERTISVHLLPRILDRLNLERGLLKIIRTDNGKEFYGRAILT